MPEPVHQLRQCRAGRRCQRGAGVAQVMPTEIGTAGGEPGPVEVPVQRPRSHLTIRAAGGREQQRAAADRDMLGEVPLELGQQMRRNADVTNAGGRLRSPDNRLLAGDTGHGAANSDHPLVKVEVDAAQLEDLPVPQPAPGGDEHSEPEPVGRVLGDDRQLLQGWPAALCGRL